MSIPCGCCPINPAGCYGINGDPAQPVYGFRCPSGTSTVTRWFDAAGAEVQQPDVRPCGEATQNIAVQLTATGTFFGDGGDPAGENLCNFNHLPDVLVGWTNAGGGCYDPPLGGNPSLQWTTPITSLVFEYGNLPHTSGGAFLTFTSPSLGTVTWPNTGQLDPGQSVLSNALTAGRRVLLTYLSGPPGSAPSGSVQVASSSQLWFHRNSTDNTTPPIRVRLDFLDS